MFLYIIIVFDLSYNLKIHHFPSVLIPVDFNLSPVAVVILYGKTFEVWGDLKGLGWG
jgi:hypothetical protein